MADTVEGLVKRLTSLIVRNPDGSFVTETDAALSEAASALEALVVERDEARGKVARQATEIQRMARKIKNQRGMARMTWDIVESRAHWTRGILNRNKYLDMTMVASSERRAAEARALAAEAQRDKLQTEIDAARLFGGGYFADIVQEHTREFYRDRARSTLDEIAP